LTLPNEPIMKRCSSPVQGASLEHVTLSSVMAVVYGIKNNHDLLLDTRTLIRNVMTVMNGFGVPVHLDDVFISNLIQKHLDKLISSGFLRENGRTGEITLTNTGLKLGKIKYTSMKENAELA